MLRVLTALFLTATLAFAANIKLFLKDGSFQLVREYQVESERVRFYSVERSQWEEIPLELVDLKRTEAEQAERKAVLDKEAKDVAEEDAALRGMREEVAKIPRDPGVYYVQGGEVKVVKVAECTVHNDKGRSVLKVLSPIPMVSGKSTLETNGLHSTNVLTNPEQEFYVQLSNEERFGLIRLKAERGLRIVEKITIIPVTKEVVEEPDEVQIFRKQMTQDGLFKIWPMKPLPVGEYAVVEWTPGKINMQVWDFAIARAE